MPPDDTTGIDVAERRLEDGVSTSSRTLREHRPRGADARRPRRPRRHPQAIEESKPHIVFNLLEDFDDVTIFDQNVVSYLELLRLPYTGCNPRGLMLARDKALSKKLLAYHRIPVPEFTVCPIGRGRSGGRSGCGSR